MRIALLYPNGAMMVYAEDKPLGEIKRMCEEYNYQATRSHKPDALAKVVLVEVTMRGDVKP